jgi:hypothetical protein
VPKAWLNPAELIILEEDMTPTGWIELPKPISVEFPLILRQLKFS